MKLHVISQEKGEKCTYIELNKEIPIGWCDKTVEIDGKKIKAKFFFDNYLKIEAVGKFIGKDVILDDAHIDRNIERFTS